MNRLSPPLGGFTLHLMGTIQVPILRGVPRTAIHKPSHMTLWAGSRRTANSTNPTSMILGGTGFRVSRNRIWLLSRRHMLMMNGTVSPKSQTIRMKPSLIVITETTSSTNGQRTASRPAIIGTRIILLRKQP